MGFGGGIDVNSDVGLCCDVAGGGVGSCSYHVLQNIGTKVHEIS
jgi:hypothetical protein